MPLLGLPLELRFRIYDVLFSDHYLALEIKCTESTTHEALDTGRLSHCVSIDDGITLTCQQIRAETVAHLKKGIGLRCYLPPSPVKVTSASLCGKPMYLELIRRIQIVISDDMWIFPFEAFTNLEEVHIETADMSLDPLHAAADETELLELARSRDFRDLVRHIANAVNGLDLAQEIVNMLGNKGRGFRVIWKDQYQALADAQSHRVSSSADTCLPQTDVRQWIVFDWDTLEILDGAGDLEADAAELVLKHERQASDDEKTLGASNAG